MTGQMTPRDIWVWRNEVSADKTLFVSTRLVLLRLSFHAEPDKGGMTWASQGQLAGEVGMPRSSIQRHLASGRERGWLTIATRVRNKADRYQLTYLDRTTAGTVATCVSGPIQIGQQLSYPDRSEAVLSTSVTSSPDVAPAESGLLIDGDASASAGATATASPLPYMPGPHRLAAMFSDDDWSALGSHERADDWSAVLAQPGGTCAGCGKPTTGATSFNIDGETRHTWCPPTITAQVGA